MDASTTQTALVEPAKAAMPQSRSAGSTRRKLLNFLGLAALQIVMTIVLVTFLIPTLWMISSSLKASTEIFAHPIVWVPESPQWQNYVRLFTNPSLPFPRFIWNTFVVTGLAVAGTVISSAMVAYSFSRITWPGRKLVFGLMLATMMLPEIVTLVPRFILFRNLGWIGTIAPLTVPYWFAATGLYVFLIHQFFRGLPIELEEAAHIDGASRWQILVQILLPLSKPVLATVAVFALIQHYNDFLNPLIYLNRRDAWVLSLGIRALNDTNAAIWEMIFAAGTVMLIPILILFVVAQRYFVQGIALTGFGGR